MALLSNAKRRTQDRIYRITVDQYHEMIAKGILPEGEPYELLNGRIVRKDRSAVGDDPMMHGDLHIWVIMKLSGLNRQLERLGCHLRPQMALALPPFNEPEPDGAIVKGTVDDYRHRKPRAKDTLCVIEVADATLRYDRTRKLRIYANSGIAVYVIINLPDRVIEIYSEPIKGKGRYARTETLRHSQRVSFPTASQKALTIPVRQLLP